MVENGIEYQILQPDPELAGFVESFWMLSNRSGEEKEVVVLPDGRFDVFFSYSDTEPFHVSLSGLGSEPSQSTLAPGLVIFAVSFKFLAIEYLLKTPLSAQLNEVNYLPENFWEITAKDLSDLENFTRKVSQQIRNLITKEVDERKRNLAGLIYDSRGAVAIEEIAEKVHWSSRQINRYFQHWLGVSLKAYCNILRYRAAFNQIREGKLFPEENFTDQAHFIKAVKKYSGVTPKELNKNKNDRFIQFSTLPKP